MEFLIRSTFSLKNRPNSLDNDQQSVSLGYGRLPQWSTSCVTRQVAALSPATSANRRVMASDLERAMASRAAARAAWKLALSSADGDRW